MHLHTCTCTAYLKGYKLQKWDRSTVLRCNLKGDKIEGSYNMFRKGVSIGNDVTNKEVYSIIMLRYRNGLYLQEFPRVECTC